MIAFVFPVGTSAAAGNSKPGTVSYAYCITLGVTHCIRFGFNTRKWNQKHYLFRGQQCGTVLMIVKATANLDGVVTRK
jgi:hypothetical protein